MSIAATGNIIAGNYIGTDLGGNAEIPNQGDGVNITAANNTIGGTQSGAGNVISGNSGNGVYVTGAGNVIAANYIGTDASGSYALGNTGAGVDVGGSGNQIVRNVISANNEGISVGGTGDNLIGGNFIGTDATGNKPLGNRLYGIGIWSGQGNLIGSEDGDLASLNVISGNVGNGVSIGASGNIIAGNYIGTNLGGNAEIPNQGDGVNITAANNTIGGTQSGARNVISGNSGNGVYVTGEGNVIAENYIGTDQSGSHALGNSSTGVKIGSASNQILGNVISANGGDGGIGFANGASDNTIQGNYIGTDFTGTEALGNVGYAGIHIWGTGCQGNLIGSEDGDPALRNVISGNSGRGVSIDGGSTETANIVAGNYIGTDVTGTLPLGNGAVTAGPAVAIHDGGWDRIVGNTIAANNGQGIFINSSNNNLVAGNYIGTDSTGQLPLGNHGNGILIQGTSQSNRIGGSANPANTIAFNLGAGVAVTGTATGNTIEENSIYSNGALGIDLGGDGVTPNHLPPANSGPNLWQNYPVLSSALASETGTTVAGTLGSTPNSTFVLDFYSNATVDPSGYGQGQHYLGSASVSTGPDGNANFSVTLPVVIAQGPFITATATDANNNTSEFSAAVAAVVDGNGDGIADSGQGNVASLPNSADGTYVTLVSPGGTTLAQASAATNPSPQDVPPGVQFPVGFFDYQLGGIQPGGSTTVTVLLPLGVHPNTYYMFGPTPDNSTAHWYQFLYDGTTGAEILSDRIILHFVDGQRGDADLTANGVITDPGGPGTVATVDNTTPTTTATLAGTAGLNGWYTSAVTVTLSVSDPDDAASRLTTYYTVDGGTQQTYAAPITVSGDAIHNVTYWSVDMAGNVETAVSESIKIDGTAPTLSANIGPASPASTGWYNISTGAPTVSFSYSDSTSGLVGALPLNYTAANGDNAAYSVAIFDAAGNSATVSIPELKVDTVAPVVTLNTPPDGADYKLDDAVLANFSATDGLSGIESVTGSVANGAAIDTSSIGSKAFLVTAEDIAGNTTIVTHNYVVVGADNTTTTLVASTAAAIFGQPVTFSAAVAPAPPAGESLDFIDTTTGQDLGRRLWPTASPH